MNLVSLTFYYMAAASITSALLAVTRRNPVHSVLWVLVLFMHVAGIFLLLSAEFLAVVQVIVYAGAILIFYLFVVMLLDLPQEQARPRFGKHWPLAAAVGLGFAAIAWPGRFENDLAPPAASIPAAGSYQGNLSEVGKAFFGPFTLPFEMASLVLLAAIIGAVVLARREDSGPMIVPLGAVLGLSAILFAIGVFGFLARRNIILMLISVEVMLNAVNLSLAGFSRHMADMRGQVIALFVVAVAAAEVGVGLGLVIALNRNKPGAAVADLNKLKW